MRKQFIDHLIKVAEKDPKVILIIGDVGFKFIDEFKEKYPKQFLNAGVCEQSMMGLAVGMAREGWKPYVYSMRNFVVFRPYEQVRNDIAYAKSNVKIFGVSGSEAYAFLGYSHNVYSGKDGVDEDVRMMEHLPNMKVYNSKDKNILLKQLKAEYKREGPAYFIL